MTIDRRLAALLFALLLAMPATARAEIDEVPPLPDRKPAHVEAEAPVLPGDQPTVPWTDAEIAAAKTACDATLKDVAIDYQPLPPIQEGICGTPAPILVKSIGSDPAVAIDPPATMNCALAAGLAKWLEAKVQPEANAVLHTKVVKLRNATSYSCRNRYGGATTPLSEHALANAIDVSDFVFASGDHITVLDGWPRLAASTPSASTPSPAPKESRVASVTRSILKVSQATAPTSLPTATRDSAVILRIKANPFAAPKPPEELTPPRAAGVVASVPPADTHGGVGTTVAKNNPFVAPVPVEASTLKPAPAPVAAPLPKDATPPEAAPQDGPHEPTLAERQSVFIKTVHDEACEVFGTTLGPAANEAHKNHFHLDMKARKRNGFCE